MLRMARELEDEVGQITLHDHMIQEAAHGQHKLLLGQMAAAIHAATKHVFVPDIAVRRVRLCVPALLATYAVLYWYLYSTSN
jgi:hypothetical protein